MRILQGKSAQSCVSNAFEEATEGWAPDACPDIVFVFASPSLDVSRVSALAQAKFPSSVVVGCSSGGSHLSGEYVASGLVIAALCQTGIRWAKVMVRGLEGFDERRAQAVAKSLFDALEVSPGEIDPSEYFCLSFIDGLCMKEELVAPLIAEALEGVHVVGGSASDDVAFLETRVISEGTSYTDAAVFVLAHAKDRFEILKHQHFTKTSTDLVVTKVDGTGRRVLEIDGRPAVEGYARALGLTAEEVTEDVKFMHPVTFSCHGDMYVRAVRTIEKDGSMTFYCSLEEGMVLDVAQHSDMVRAFANDVDHVLERSGPFTFLLGYNCILRGLEARSTDQTQSMGRLWQRLSGASIGFDTFGEQLDGLHINQTLVALGLRGGEGPHG